MGGWIGFDLDGTTAVHHGSGKFDPRVIGEPVPAIIALIKKYLAEGYEVRIFTARMSDERPSVRFEIAYAIRQWTLKHVGTALEATCQKDYACIRIYDDRAVQVECNTGRIIGEAA